MSSVRHWARDNLFYVYTLGIYIQMKMGLKIAFLCDVVYYIIFLLKEKLNVAKNSVHYGKLKVEVHIDSSFSFSFIEGF